MAYVPTLKKMYKEQVVPALVKQFGYSSSLASQFPGFQNGLPAIRFCISQYDRSFFLRKTDLLS